MTAILYTCGAKTMGGSLPIVKHPCGKAANALDDAGVEYEVRVVPGFKNVPGTTRGKRQEIIDLTGQPHVPVLLLDDGTAIAGSGEIVAWARERATE
jgi:glutathione S-transferase